MSARIATRIAVAGVVAVLSVLGVTTGTASAGIFDPQTCATAFDDSYSWQYDDNSATQEDFEDGDDWTKQFYLPRKKDC